MDGAAALTNSRRPSSCTSRAATSGEPAALIPRRHDSRSGPLSTTERMCAGNSAQSSRTPLRAEAMT
jgi:hypothetical protein